MIRGEKPLISVILLTWNRCHSLAKAIECVLNQTFGNWELLVINDGSTDNTEKVVQSYAYEKRLRYLRNSSNRGSIFSRNHGISESTGTWVAILDDDDEWMLNKLEKQVGIIEKYPDVGLVFSKAHFTDDEGNVILTVPRSAIPLDQPVSGFEIFRILALQGNLIPHVSIMFKRTLALQFPYTPGFHVTDDWLLYLTLSSRNVWFYGLSEPLARINRAPTHIRLTSVIVDNLEQGLKVLNHLEDIVPPENQQLLGKLLKNKALANFLVRFIPKEDERKFYRKALLHYPFHLYAWKKWISTTIRQWKKK